MSPLMAMRLIVALGIVNLITALLIFFTCRCTPGSRLGKKLKLYKYQGLYKYHCYIWYVFWTSVIIHATLVIIFIGWPG